MHTTHFSACLSGNYSNLAQKVYKKPAKRHYHDIIKYCDILTHDNHPQLFLISPIPRHVPIFSLSCGKTVPMYV